MNYDQPREADHGGWHYTRMNDGRIWPIGYCRDHAPHEAKQQAYECYTDYLLSERLRLDGQGASDTQHRCEAKEGCETFTDRFAQVDGWHIYFLCDAHRDREHVAALHGLVGDSVHS